jgi:hypothetical protein
MSRVAPTVGLASFSVALLYNPQVGGPRPGAVEAGDPFTSPSREEGQLHAGSQWSRDCCERIRIRDGRFGWMGRRSREVQVIEELVCS